MTLKIFRNLSCRTLLVAGALATIQPAAGQLLESGGFIEDTLSDIIRPPLSQIDILGILPDIGLFSFPAPYNTEAIRLTNAQDCGGGDCVNYTGYSYWRNTNNHVGQDSMLIFLGLDKSKGGDGPTLLEYNKITDQLTNLGPLFPASSAFSWASGEGWYFSATMPTKLYVGNGGTEVLRYDVLSHEFEVAFDITTQLGADVYLWQMHSSDDDRVHSATVRDAGSYAMLGCMAFEEDSGQFHYFPKIGDFDECQIDKSGRWLVIKENIDGAQGEDNRIIDLETGNERVLLDTDGAGGHSDLGHGYMIAADNWASDANTQKLWRFEDSQLHGEVVYNNLDWGISAPAHVSHTNARPDLPPEQQFSCGSSANRSNSAHANEIVCFPLDGSGDVLVVAPVMTDLDSSNDGDYANSPKGNLDITGQYFIWTSNTGGSRLDAFLVKVPGSLLTGGSSIPGIPGIPDIPSLPSIPPPATDSDAPAISGVSATGITADSAAITWSTDEPAENMVEFGTATNYGDVSTISTNLATSHTVILSGLSPDTRYHYRVFNRDDAGNIASSMDYVFTTTGPEEDPAPQPGGLVWTDLVNVAVTGDELSKNAGCDGCADAGATSAAQITGNGYLEFTATANTGLRFIGLATGPAGTGADNIDFAIRFQAGTAEVRESGAYRAEAVFSAGDVFRIAVEDGRVTYAKNGTVLYTSNVSSTGDLRADTTFYSMGSSIANAIMVGEADDAETIPALLGHWPLDENSGSTAVDASGHGHHGSLKQGPVWTGGVAAGALSFDGHNDYVTIPHADSLNAYPLSVSLWVKTNATGLQALVNKYMPGSLNGYQIFVEDGKLCAWYFRDSTNYIWDGSSCTLSTDGVTDNQWHHVVFTVNDQGGALYVDGVETATQAWIGTPGATTTTVDVELGRYRGTASPYLPGMLDDVRLYGYRVSAGEIADYYANATSPQAGIGPVVWTDHVNVAVAGEVLSKNAGCDGCADAGAASAAQITGNGYLEFTATADTGLRVIGLTTESAGTGADSINFAIRLQGGTAEARESGVYRGETGFSAGDVFRIAVEDGSVTYAKNGTVLYTSSGSPAGGLRADITFYSMGSSISNAVIATGLPQ